MKLSAVRLLPMETQKMLSGEQIVEILGYVNKYRALHQAPPMVYDPDIASVAQTWSNYLLSNNKFQHSGNSTFGENLAWFRGYGDDPLALIKLSIDMWYDEVKYYDFKNPGFSDKTGHFTALVWKASKSFGFGFSINSITNTAVIVMNISPPGNYSGEYENNVLPMLPESPTVPPINITPIIIEPITTPPTIIIPPTPPTTNPDLVQDVLSLYQILNSVLRNKPKEIIVNQIKSLIRSMNAQL